MTLTLMTWTTNEIIFLSVHITFKNYFKLRLIQSKVLLRWVLLFVLIDYFNLLLGDLRPPLLAHAHNLLLVLDLTFLFRNFTFAFFLLMEERER